jgi:hypothetical protein
LRSFFATFAVKDFDFGLANQNLKPQRSQRAPQRTQRKSEAMPMR